MEPHVQWERPPRRPLTEVERLALACHMTERHSGPQELERELRSAVARRDWRDAIQLADQMVPYLPVDDPWRGGEELKWEWQAGIGQLHLFGLGPQEAMERYRGVLEGFAPPESGSWARRLACLGMARASAETGDFEAALKWRDQSDAEQAPHRGNCGELRQHWTHAVATVRTAARQPSRLAEPALVRITEGDFTPLPARLYPEEFAAEAQIQHARVEASLNQGELYLRQGAIDRARAPLAFSAEANEEVSYLAESHLARCG